MQFFSLFMCLKARNLADRGELRLGRISFRAIKSKRDYLGNKSSASWMYMSRLAAQKEFAFMKVSYALRKVCRTVLRRRRD